jgi:hypothetical protein
MPDPQGKIYYRVRCYWDYWRLLTAKGTTLAGSKFDPVPAAYFDDNIGWKKEVENMPGENSTQMMAGLVVVPQQQTKVVTLETRLPGTVLKLEGDDKIVYTLRVQKQAGIVSLPFDIEVSGPRGYKLIASDEQWKFDAGRNIYSWSGKLTSPQDFRLEFIREN